MLVEFCVVLILLVVVSAGILEYGTLLGSTVDVSSVVRSGARAGASSTTTLATDEDVLQSVLSSPNNARNNIDKVIIYKVRPGTDGPPDVCKTHYPPPPGQKCDVYVAADFALTSSQRATLPAANNWSVASRVGGSDYLGVWVSVTRKPLIGIVWSPTRYEDHFSMLIEPPQPAGPATSAAVGKTWAVNHNIPSVWVDDWWCSTGSTSCTVPIDGGAIASTVGKNPGTGGA